MLYYNLFNNDRKDLSMNLSTLFVAIAIVLSSASLTGCGTVKGTGAGFVEGVKSDVNDARNYVADVIRPNN